MANGSMEQMMLEEQKRVTRGAAGTGSKQAGLLDLVKPIASAPPRPSPTLAKPAILRPSMTQLAAAGPVISFTKAAPTLAALQLNKGYTAPAPSTPPAQSSPSAASSGGGVAAEAGMTALKVFTSGLGMMPLISGLAGLFSSGSKTVPPPLVKYAMPRSLQVTASNSKNGGSFQLADYGQDGTARTYGATAEGTSPTSSGPAAARQGAGQSGGGSSTQVVVNVQAMDSRSFLDHSEEIAQAVREAMLNMHALNDVVSEL